MTTVLDPTGERQVAERALLDRPSSIEGKVVGLLDITKPRGDVFLDHLEQGLRRRGAADVVRFAKPTYTKPAPVDLRHEISTKCDLVIEALAD
ncbi:hypothetical protein NHL50_08835 [Acidimicrobiia bacterium EGI L10123]|nr:hypothetical protein [Acidimicrobiia bacterium EGI L10123]|tara:strand:- start:95 stop:373 length:279 start_codon:yes stop_codon:yes gene_type:complete